METLVHPVVLCGGSGTRLWPLSRQSYPKQFVPLMGPESLFQATLRRVAGAGFAAPVVLTGDDFRFIVSEQLAGADCTPEAILIEPDARNTAPALLAAALWLAARDPQAVLLVLPSDHVIPDAAAFRAAVLAALPRALAGDIVTFGVVPTRPETGYGYLHLAQAPTPPPIHRSPWPGSSKNPMPRPRCGFWRAGGTCGTPASSCSPPARWWQRSAPTAPTCCPRPRPRWRACKAI